MKMTEQGTRTVLVVEDVEEISSQMAAVLRRKGHQVIFASDAREAIQAAEYQSPALILTDLDLPTFDTLLNLVREHDQLKKVDVVVVDIDDPDLKREDVKVLSNFEQLDHLLR